MTINAQAQTGSALQLVWKGKQLLEPVQVFPTQLMEVYAQHSKAGPDFLPCPLTGGTIFQSDNLAVLAWLASQGPSGKIQLAYLDPPFGSGANYARTVRLRGVPAELKQKAFCRSIRGTRQYQDKWTNEDYLQFMYTRLSLLKNCLAEDGSVFLHADHHHSHHLRCLMDELFGTGVRGGPGFRNELVWGYGGGGAARRHYPHKHDTILWYTKGNQWVFQKQFRPYTKGTRQRGLTQTKGPRYQLSDRGAGLDDWWTDSQVQKILSPTAEENSKYPTQKPKNLLRRILEGHSRPGDLILDPFMGSGTTVVTAALLGRRWIGCDDNPGAIAVATLRLLQTEAWQSGFGVWRFTDPHLHEPEIPAVAADVSVKHELGQISVQINQYDHPSIWEMLKIPRSQAHKLNWRCLVEGVAIDLAYDGAVFRPQHLDVPRGHNAWVSGSYHLPGHFAQALGQVAVKIVDISGTSSIVLIPHPL